MQIFLSIKCQTNGTSLFLSPFLVAFILRIVPYWTGYSHLTNQTPFFMNSERSSKFSQSYPTVIEAVVYRCVEGSRHTIRELVRVVTDALQQQRIAFTKYYISWDGNKLGYQLGPKFRLPWCNRSVSFEIYMYHISKCKQQQGRSQEFSRGTHGFFKSTLTYLPPKPH